MISEKKFVDHLILINFFLLLDKLKLEKNWINTMHNEFTALIEKDGDWYIAYCPEVPGANGQGKTIEECKANLAEAISLIINDRRQDAIRGLPEDAIREVVDVS